MLICTVLVGEQNRTDAERLFKSLPSDMDLLVFSDLEPAGVLATDRVLWRRIDGPTSHPINGMRAGYLRAMALQQALALAYEKVLYLDAFSFFSDRALTADSFSFPEGMAVLTQRPRELIKDNKWRYAKELVAHIEKSSNEPWKEALARATTPLEGAILLAAKRPVTHLFVETWLEVARYSIENKLWGEPEAVDYGLALELSKVPHAEAKALWLDGIHFFSSAGDELDLRHQRTGSSATGTPKAPPVNAYATHQPLLAWAVSYCRPAGRVLELGCGDFSTTLLHALCSARGHFLFSAETDPYFARAFRWLKTDWHALLEIKDWNQLAVDCPGPWDVVFVDHAPADRRRVELAWARDKSTLVVVHDTEPQNEHVHGYQPVMAQFKYRFDYKASYPWTSVLSMTVPVDELLARLFPTVA